MHNIGKTEFMKALGVGVLHSLFSLFVILSSIWLCMALWIQEPFSWLWSRILIGAWIAFALSILGIYAAQPFFSRKKDVIIYILGFICGLLWYFGLEAQQDRAWARRRATRSPQPPTLSPGRRERKARALHGRTPSGSSASASAMRPTPPPSRSNHR